jgi:hypothetical protein
VVERQPVVVQIMLPVNAVGGIRSLVRLFYWKDAQHFVVVVVVLIPVDSNIIVVVLDHCFSLNVRSERQRCLHARRLTQLQMP